MHKSFIALLSLLPFILPFVLSAAPIHLVDEAPVHITELEDDHYLVDFGKVSFGNLRLLPGPGNEGTVTVHFGEAMKDGRIDRQPKGTVRYQKTEVALKGGEPILAEPPADQRNTKNPKAVLTPEAWGVVLPFRWAEIEGWQGSFGPDNIVRQSAFSSTWDDGAADFKSSNDLLNQIWELCKYSIKATTFAGVYVDGDRERIPYEADAYLNQLSHYYTDNDFEVARDTIRHLFESPTWPTEWPPHLVFMVHADYMYSGDKSFLREQYENLKTVLLMDRRGDDQLIASKRGQQRPDIVDWPPGERDGYVFTERNTVVNAFHLRALELMAEMAQALDKPDQAKHYTELYASAYEAFQEAFYDPERGLYLDGVRTDHSSLHANLFPLAFGLVPEAQRERIAAWLAARGMKCSVYAAQYLLEALFENGQSQAAIDLMMADTDRSWKHMVESGTTITWEAWDFKYKGNQDWNHAWGAAPANIIPRYILGVEPIRPGFEMAHVRPLPGRLESAKGHIPSIHGPIHVALKNKVGEPFQFDVAIPAGMRARVDLPLPEGEGEVLHNGRAVKSEKVDGFAVIYVDAGVHRFQTTARVKEAPQPEMPEILRASYGSETKRVDVTSILRERPINSRGSVDLSGGYNAHFGDPHRKTVKTLNVEYRLNGAVRTPSFKEDATVILD